MILKVGDVYSTSKCGDIVITDYISAKEVKVRFLDSGTEVITAAKEIRSGGIRDHLAPTVFGVGYLDGCRGYVNNKATVSYRRWFGMLARCYDEYTQRVQPTYKDCTISETFKSFAMFDKWANSCVGSEKNKWALDKDILVKGNKVYSEDTCCFVPQDVNNLFVLRKGCRGDYPIGVRINYKKFSSCVMYYGKVTWLGDYDTPEEAFYAYKEAKEAYIKEVAEKYKGQIDHRVYESLMNWKIEITD